MNTLLPFSYDRRGYRAFGHAMAAEHGLVAMIPLTEMEGSLLDLVDGCPVPWAEACAVLDAVTDTEISLDSERFTPAVSRLAAVARDGWKMGFLADLKAVVFGHSSGVKIAIAADLALKP